MLLFQTHPYVKFQKILKGKQVGYLHGHKPKHHAAQNEQQDDEDAPKQGFWAKLFRCGC